MNKKNKVKTCAIVNVVESSIARESKFVLPIHCGPEIGVASTKAFLGQMLVIYILSLKIAKMRKEIDKKIYQEKINNNQSELLDELEDVLAIVKDIKESNPMLGLRGCRLGILYPDIVAMQTKAILTAACTLIQEGNNPIPEIMIPLVSTDSELKIFPNGNPITYISPPFFTFSFEKLK